MGASGTSGLSSIAGFSTQDASYTQGLPLYVASNDSAYGFSHYGQFGYVDDCQTGTDDIASESVGQGQYLVSMSLVRHDAVSTKVAPN